MSLRQSGDAGSLPNTIEIDPFAAFCGTIAISADASLEVKASGTLTLKGATVQRVVAGQFRIRCTALGGLDMEVELHFEPRVGGRLKQVEILRMPTRRKRKGFDDLQGRLVSRLGSGVPVKASAVAQMDGVAPRLWRCGFLNVTHDYYYQGAQYEKVLFDWSG